MDTITTSIPSHHTSKCNCEDCFINLRRGEKYR